MKHQIKASWVSQDQGLYLNHFWMLRTWQGAGHVLGGQHILAEWLIAGERICPFDSRPSISYIVPSVLTWQKTLEKRRVRNSTLVMSRLCKGREAPGHPWKQPAFPRKYLDSRYLSLMVRFQGFPSLSLFSLFRRLISLNDVSFLLTSSTSTPPTLPSPPNSSFDHILSVCTLPGTGSGMWDICRWEEAFSWKVKVEDATEGDDP